MSNDNHNPKNPGYPQGNPNIVEAGRATRFAPGRSGNPSGRPSTRVLTEEVLKELASQSSAEFTSELGLSPDATSARVIAARVVRQAAAGEPAAIREVFDRTEGKPPKEVAFEDKRGAKLVVEYATPLDPVRALRSQLSVLVLEIKEPEIKKAAEELEMLLSQKTGEPSVVQSLKKIAG